MGVAVVTRSGELSRLKLVEGLKSLSPEGSYREPLYQFQAIFILEWKLYERQDNGAYLGYGSQANPTLCSPCVCRPCRP